MASPVNVITRLGTSVCNPNRLIDRSGKLYHCAKPVKNLVGFMVYPREFVSQNWLKGISSVETPKNDMLVGG